MTIGNTQARAESHCGNILCYPFALMRRVFLPLLFLAGLVSPLASAPQIQNPAGAQAPPSSAASSEPAPLEEALQLFRTGKYDAAVEKYKALISAGTKPAEAYAGLARTYLKLHKVAEASTAAAKAVELSTDLPDAHAALGEVYFRQAKLTEAEHEFLGVIRGGKPNARAFLGMARMSAMNSFYAQAKQMIDRAYALDPADPDVQEARYMITGAEEPVEIKPSSTGDGPKKDGGAAELPNVVKAIAADAPAGLCRMISHTNSMQANLIPMLNGPNRIHGYGLNVKVNGTSASLLLDTGSTGILVDRRIAERAKIKRIVDQKIRGIGDKGAATGYVGLAASVRIGDLEFQNCYVDVVDKNNIIGDDGLIGADVFEDFLVELNLPDSKMKLLPLPQRPPEAAAPATAGNGEKKYYNRYVAPEMKTYSPVARFGHQLLVRTQINSGATRLFLLDTGSLLNSISPDAARDVTKVSHDDTIRMKGLSGEVKNIFSGDEVTLTFGGLRQRNLDIVAFDTSSLSNDIGTEVSGILRFGMLRLLNIKIDYRDGLVEFNFDEKRFR